jgi:hypothetical protein
MLWYRRIMGAQLVSPSCDFSRQGERVVLIPGLENPNLERHSGAAVRLRRGTARMDAQRVRVERLTNCNDGLTPTERDV